MSFSVPHCGKDSHGQNGQYDSVYIHKQDGRDKVLPSLPSDHGPIAMVSGQGHGPTIASSSGGGQSTGRCSVPPLFAKQGVGPQSSHSSVSFHNVGSTCHRSVRINSQCQAPQLLHFLPQSPSSGEGCFFNKLGSVPSSVCISPSHSVAQGFAKDLPGQGQGNFDSSQVASEELVYQDSKTISRGASATPSVARSPHSGEVHPSRPSQVRLSCMEAERNQLRNRGFSEQVTDTMLRARKPSTQSCYNAKWARFCGWCDERAVNPALASVPLICEFLQSLFDQGLQYSTLCGYVSAISVAHPSYVQDSLGQINEISQFLKGVFRLRPQVKSIVPRWDLAIVLDVLCESPYEPPESASLQAWTWKTVFLIALLRLLEFWSCKL